MPPTLRDFRDELLRQPEEEAHSLALELEIFTNGSLDTFAKQTNVDTENRLICYDIMELGEQLRPVGMLVILDSIINRITSNRRKGRQTFVFIDESQDPYDDTAIAYALKRTETKSLQSIDLAKKSAAYQAKNAWKKIRERRKKQAHISAVTQKNENLVGSFNMPDIFGKSLYKARRGVKLSVNTKNAVRNVRKVKYAAKFILTSASFMLCLLALIIPLSAAAALFGNDGNDESLSEYDMSIGSFIAATAKAEIGNEGGEKYWTWYGFEEKVDWCACFVSWCLNEAAKAAATGEAPKFAVCDDGIRLFIEQGLWYRKSIEPKIGMIIFFDWDNDGTSEHTGIVIKCENGLVYTVEGNSSDICRKKRYAADDKAIMGYGMLGSR